MEETMPTRPGKNPPRGLKKGQEGNMSESGATHLTYFGVVARDTEGRFVARFPDFPECVIRRPMLDQILDNADKAVRRFPRGGARSPAGF